MSERRKSRSQRAYLLFMVKMGASSQNTLMVGVLSGKMGKIADLIMDNKATIYILAGANEAGKTQ